MTGSTVLLMPSIAKINLFLKVLKQRDDGYHELQTLFQLLGYGDRLLFEVLPDNRIELQQKGENSVIPVADNLIYKAVTLLKKATGCSRGVRIILQKYLPMGAGLGGGSSNAATTLVVLNHLWQTRLKLLELKQLALVLGADVPVFVQGESAYASGVGEVLTPVALDTWYYLIMTPNCHSNTKAVFSDPRLIKNNPAISFADYEQYLGENDCETVAKLLYPEIDEVLGQARKFHPTYLTGTGSSMFMRFQDPLTAKKMCRKLLASFKDRINIFFSQGINRSPLCDLLITD